MKHPPYYLRPNKIIDRAALVEAIHLLSNGKPLSDYTYYGMGGPFLEEYRLLYEAYPTLKMVSFEEDKETYRRQQFHRPCRVLKLRHKEFKSFLRTYDSGDQKSIFWTDYTGLKFDHIDSFMTLLQKVAVGSMIKITLQAEANVYRKCAARDRFRREFDNVLPHSTSIPSRLREFAAMLQGIMHTAAQKALRGFHDHVFQPVSSLCYRDSTGMYTLTGVLCLKTEQSSVEARFKEWQFANLDWDPPMYVDIPDLTTKERHHLQSVLPCADKPGETLQKRLGYMIDRDAETSVKKLNQWAQYHRHAASFVKALP